MLNEWGRFDIVSFFTVLLDATCGGNVEGYSVQDWGDRKETEDENAHYGESWEYGTRAERG